MAGSGAHSGRFGQIVPRPAALRGDLGRENSYAWCREPGFWAPASLRRARQLREQARIGEGGPGGRGPHRASRLRRACGHRARRTQRDRAEHYDGRDRRGFQRGPGHQRGSERGPGHQRAAERGPGHQRAAERGPGHQRAAKGDLAIVREGQLDPVPRRRRQHVGVPDDDRRRDRSDDEQDRLGGAGPGRVCGHDVLDHRGRRDGNRRRARLRLLPGRNDRLPGAPD